MKNKSNIYEPEYIKNLFNAMSVSYERMNYIASFGFSHRWRHQFLKKISKKERGLQVLDLLSGMGETWVPIKKQFPGCAITAIDFCDGMNDRADKKNGKKFSGGVQICRQDVLQNNLPSASFDVIICCFGLKTFNEDQLVLLASQVERLLKPGGEFSFIEVSVPANKVLQFFYKFYLCFLIPLIGKMMLGNPKEYRMLWNYTSLFGNANKPAEIFASKGLDTRKESYFFGCATGISGNKSH